jgi:LysM repeat protein
MTPAPTSWFSRLGLGLLALLAMAVLAVPQEVATGTYVVKAGDTLGEIARQHGTTAERLQALNGIRDPRALKTGQSVRVPLNYRTHTVRAGESLSTIAKRSGLTVEAIVAANNLRRPDDIAVGQELRLPLAGAAPSPAAPTALSPAPGPAFSAAPAPAALPAATLAELAKVRVSPTKWKYIVIHHSASTKGNLAAMDAYHRNERKMENGLAYHFVIGNGQGMRDGEIALGNRWRRQIKGGHLANPQQNEFSIGICLVGNFEQTRPTGAQLRSLQGLLAWLTTNTRVPRQNIKTHTQINTRPTACPGRLFPTRDMAHWRLGLPPAR